MLLNIFDTKEVFVKELQVILAEKLLASKDYGSEKEVPFNWTLLMVASKY
jgi:anaphase-promoting complex subunit 2